MDSVTLTPEQLDDLRALETAHNVIRQEIERAKSAGLDMTEYEAKLNEMERIRSGVLKVYGGKQSRRIVT